MKHPEGILEKQLELTEFMPLHGLDLHIVMPMKGSMTKQYWHISHHLS